jgi:hypothetical protein
MGRFKTSSGRQRSGTKQPWFIIDQGGACLQPISWMTMKGQINAKPTRSNNVVISRLKRMPIPLDLDATFILQKEPAFKDEDNLHH